MKNRFSKPFKFILSTSIDSSGMSMVETIISITLLSLFFTIYSGFVQLASRFTAKENTNLDNSNGLLIDHHYLSITLDKYANFLSQPAITLDEITNFKQKKLEGLPIGCTNNPIIDWKLPFRQKPISGTNWETSKAGYAICLRSSSVFESSMSDLISKSRGNSSNSQPGLYFLLALPNELTINGLPMRKMFCRPSTFC